jgi:hypothetical protein
VVIILLITIMAIKYAPPEGDANNALGDLPGTPTVVAINQLSTLSVQQGVDLNGIHVSVESAVLAQNFSDDHKLNGAYTLRVLVDTQNTTGNALGYPFDANVHLILPGGQIVATKLISVMASSLPKQAQSGYFDFPLQQPVELAQLKLQFARDNGVVVVAFNRQA